MRAVILAAGIGYRLLPITEEIPKCLVPVSGKSIISRAVYALLQNGIRDIVVVVGYKKEMIRNALLSEFEGRADFTFVENDIFDQTNNIYSLWLASKWFDDDIILLESDVVFDPGILTSLISSPDTDVMVVDEPDAESDGTMVKVDENGTVHHLLTREQQTPRQDKSDFLKTVNIYKFSHTFLTRTFYPVLERHIKSRNLSKYYEIVLGIIVRLDQPVLKALRVNRDKWYEIDTYPDLVRADYLFSPPSRRFSALEKSWGGYWHYTGFTDFMFMGNPWFPPDALLLTMQERLGALIRNYGSAQKILNKKAAILEYLQEEFLFLFNGASQAIAFLSGMTGTISIPVPTFQEYINRLDPKSVHQYRLPMDTFRCDPEKLAEAALDAGSDTLVILNPNNPTGSFIEKEAFLSLLEAYAGRFRFIVVDESFIDFANRKHSLSDQVQRFPNLVIIKSMGKTYGVPGLRLGYIYSASPDIKAAFEAHIPIWNINSMAEFFMEEAMKYRDAYNDSLAMIKKERERLREDLAEIPHLKTFGSHANFVMVEPLPSSPLNAAGIKEFLFSRHGLLVKDLSPKIFESHPAYAGKGFLRFAVLKRKDNERLLEGLKDAVKHPKE
jgi:histidinol-phosphate/aromatic aminotransferase/cobyric acid decarboxylase-like protein/GTP:adenosylcobinamide-phosphate guanylyltransferase